MGDFPAWSHGCAREDRGDDPWMWCWIASNDVPERSLGCAGDDYLGWSFDAYVGEIGH